MIRISLLSFFSHLVLNAFGILLFYSEPVVRRISKIHRKLTVTESFFNKVAGRLKKRLRQCSLRTFPEDCSGYYIFFKQFLKGISEIIGTFRGRFIFQIVGLFSEAVARRCYVKKVFREISQNSQESTCVRVSVLISRRSEAATLLKKRTWHTCFPVNFGKFLRTPFIMEHLWWLLLSFCYFCLGQGMLMSPVTIGNTDYIDKVFMQA